MRTTAQFKVEGLDELKAALKALPKKYKTRVIRDAHKEQLKSVKKIIRANGPTSGSKKARNWSVRNDRSRYKRNPTAAILAPTTDVFYLRYRERGTTARVIKKGVQNPKPFTHPRARGGKTTTYKMGAFKGARRGKVTARPWIEKIYVAQARKVIENIKPVYRETMETVLRRHGVRIRKRIGKLN